MLIQADTDTVFTHDFKYTNIHQHIIIGVLLI